MALLWIEGFESFGSVSPGDVMGEKYPNSTNLTSNDSIATGRFDGGRSFQWGNSSGRLKTPSINNSSTIIVGFAFRAEGTFGLEVVLVGVYEDGGSTFGFHITTKNLDLVIRRSGTILETVSNAFNTGQWHYLEFKVTANNSTGSYEVRLDGSTIASGTSVDTQQGDGVITHVALGGASQGEARKLDDWYICNTSGSKNNDFLGSRKVITIFPNGAGDSTDWTPSTGSNYQQVDDDGHDGDTSYVESATTNDDDLYTFEDLSNMTSIDGIQINAIARVTDVDAFNLHLLSKTGTTTDAGSAISVPSSSYTNKHRILENDPDTAAAWTDGGIDGAQFGLRVG